MYNAKPCCFACPISCEHTGLESPCDEELLGNSTGFLAGPKAKGSILELTASNLNFYEDVRLSEFEAYMIFCRWSLALGDAQVTGLGDFSSVLPQYVVKHQWRRAYDVQQFPRGWEDVVTMSLLFVFLQNDAANAQLGPNLCTVQFPGV